MTPSGLNLKQEGTIVNFRRACSILLAIILSVAGCVLFPSGCATATLWSDAGTTWAGRSGTSADIRAYVTNGKLVTSWVLYDNSGPTHVPLASGDNS